MDAGVIISKRNDQMFNNNDQDVSQKLFLMSQMSNKRDAKGTKEEDAINVITVGDTCDFDQLFHNTSCKNNAHRKKIKLKNINQSTKDN